MDQFIINFWEIVNTLPPDVTKSDLADYVYVIILAFTAGIASALADVIE